MSLFVAKPISTYVYGIFAYDIPQGIVIYDYFGGKNHFKFLNMQLQLICCKSSSDFSKNLEDVIVEMWSEIVTVKE